MLFACIKRRLDEEEEITTATSTNVLTKYKKFGGFGNKS